MEQTDIEIGANHPGVVAGENVALVGVELGRNAPPTDGLLERLVKGLGIGPFIVSGKGNQSAMVIDN